MATKVKFARVSTTVWMYGLFVYIYYYATFYDEFSLCSNDHLQEHNTKTNKSLAMVWRIKRMFILWKWTIFALFHVQTIKIQAERNDDKMNVLTFGVNDDKQYVSTCLVNFVIFFVNHLCIIHATYKTLTCGTCEWA